MSTSFGLTVDRHAVAGTGRWRSCVLAALGLGLGLPGRATAQVFEWPTAAGGNGHFYEYVTTPTPSWNAANAAAQSRAYLGVKGHLASITHVGENEFVRQLRLKMGLNDMRAWIGLSDPAGTSNWQWVTGEPFGYANWGAGEPNNIGSERWVEFFASGVWNNNTETFFQNQGYVVEYETRLFEWPTAMNGNGHFYQYVTSPTSWSGASAAAQSFAYLGMAGHLVTITSAFENEFVRQLHLQMGLSDMRAWIGLSDPAGTSKWQWVTGEPFGYSNWGGGEPNNIGFEKWVEFFASGVWNNNVGTFGAIQGYVVEYEAGADLSLSVTDSPDPVRPDIELLTYAVTLTNAGPSAAAQSPLGFVRFTPGPAVTSWRGTFTDSGPAGANWSCGSTPPDFTLYCGLFSGGSPIALPPGETRFHVLAGIAPTAAGLLTTTVGVSSLTSDPQPGNNTVTVTTAVASLADLSLQVVDSPDPVHAGGRISFNASLNDAGPGAAQNARLVFTLPAGIGGNVVTGGGIPCSASGATWTCDFGTLAAGSATSFLVSADVLTTTPSGPLTSQFQLTSAAIETNPGNESVAVTTTVIELDRTPPQIEITGGSTIEGVATLRRTAMLRGFASDNVGVSQVTWTNETARGTKRGIATGTDLGNPSWIARGIPLEAGLNAITVIARDEDGNTASRARSVVRVAEADALAALSFNGAPVLPAQGAGELVLGSPGQIVLEVDAGLSPAAIRLMLNGAVVPGAVSGVGGRTLTAQVDLEHLPRDFPPAQDQPFAYRLSAIVEQPDGSSAFASFRDPAETALPIRIDSPVTPVAAQDAQSLWTPLPPVTSGALRSLCRRPFGRRVGGGRRPRPARERELRRGGRRRDPLRDSGGRDRRGQRAPALEWDAMAGLRARRVRRAGSHLHVRRSGCRRPLDRHQPGPVAGDAAAERRSDRCRDAARRQRPCRHVGDVASPGRLGRALRGPPGLALLPPAPERNQALLARRWGRQREVGLRLQRVPLEPQRRRVMGRRGRVRRHARGARRVGRFLGRVGGGAEPIRRHLELSEREHEHAICRRPDPGRRGSRRSLGRGPLQRGVAQGRHVGGLQRRPGSPSVEQRQRPAGGPRR